MRSDNGGGGRKRLTPLILLTRQPLLVFLAVFGYYTDMYPSAITPWTTLGPLLGVISVSLVNEALTDLARHKSDRAVNNSLVTLVTRRATGEEDSTEVSSSTLRPGDVIRVTNMSVCPADAVLVKVEQGRGEAYVETSGVDGETNLKVRTTPVGLADWQGVPDGATLSLPSPTKNITSFSGTLHPPSGPPVPLTPDSLLLRSHVLRNTPSALLLVCYTGPRTKLALNSRKAPSKLSNLDRLVNRAIWIIILAMCVVVSICAR